MKFEPVLALTPVLLLLAGSAAPSARGESRVNPAVESKLQPFVTKYCAGCHNSKVQSGGLNLSASPIAAERWEKIAERIRNRQMPPAGAPRPGDAEIESATRTIATELDRLHKGQKPDPGHITARRLNRTEYDNSVRDLLAVTFRPADDFPPDDSGYGFDNIGSVLSVSPSLMEKYASAAEKVARMAVYGPPKLKPNLVKHEPWYTDFDTTPGVKTEYDETGMNLPSALHVMHNFPVEGDYDIAGLLRGARPPGSEPLQVAFWMDGKQIQVIPYAIPASGEVSGQRKEFRTHVPAGEHWMSVSILKIYEGLPVAFKGPNPSKLPPPPPRNFGGGRGGRGGGRGGAPAAAPAKAPVAPNNDEVAAANGNGVFGGGATVGFLVSNLEVTGPYNQISGPSAESRKKIFVCGEQTPACARKIVASLASHIYRRPATPAEIEQLAGIAAMVQASGDSFDEGICLAIEKMLISPNFLFRIEQEKKAAGPVSDHELASRLSYFLWSSTPDDELLRLAADRRLRRPEVLNAQVRRMLRDSKSKALVDDFAGQWLQFRGLESHEPDRKKFQQYTEYTRMSIAKETELFFENLMREDRPVTELIDAKYSFLNERLADFYAVPGVKGTDFRKVDLSSTGRQGVLTQASVLTISSYANRTSPVLRGKWVLENIFNAPPPPPPPNVPNLDEAAVGSTASMREQMEKHRANAVCASCHSRMDPIGFSLENYDAIGQRREKDGKFPIDASGQLPDGRKFNGAGGLAEILMSDRNAFAKAMTEKMLTYALGRGLEPFDQQTVKKIVPALAAQQYRFSAMVLQIVNSLPFQQQRASAPKSEQSKAGPEGAGNVPHA